jgi:hypothetical protein
MTGDRPADSDRSAEDVALTITTTEGSDVSDNSMTEDRPADSDGSAEGVALTITTAEGNDVSEYRSISNGIREVLENFLHSDHGQLGCVCCMVHLQLILFATTLLSNYRLSQGYGEGNVYDGVSKFRGMGISHDEIQEMLQQYMEPGAGQSLTNPLNCLALALVSGGVMLYRDLRILNTLKELKGCSESLQSVMAAIPENTLALGEGVVARVDRHLNQIASSVRNAKEGRRFWEIFSFLLPIVTIVFSARYAFVKSEEHMAETLSNCIDVGLDSCREPESYIDPPGVVMLNFIFLTYSALCTCLSRSEESVLIKKIKEVLPAEMRETGARSNTEPMAR